MTNIKQTFETVLNIGQGTKPNKQGIKPPRLWIENSQLLKAANFHQGDFVTLEKGLIIKRADSKKKVSGKAGKPLLDITGKSVLLLVGKTTGKVLLSASENQIIVKAID